MTCLLVYVVTTLAYVRCELTGLELLRTYSGTEFMCSAYLGSSAVAGMHTLLQDVCRRLITFGHTSLLHGAVKVPLKLSVGYENLMSQKRRMSFWNSAKETTLTRPGNLLGCCNFSDDLQFLTYYVPCLLRSTPYIVCTLSCCTSYFAVARFLLFFCVIPYTPCPCACNYIVITMGGQHR